MALPNILVMRAQGTGRVYELRGGSILQAIGPTVPSHTASLAETDQYTGYVARLSGALIGFFGRAPSTLGIYRYDPDTDTWPKTRNLDVYASSTGIVDGHQNLGFAMVAGTNGHPYLIAAFRDTFQVLAWLRINSPTNSSIYRAGLNYSLRPGGMSQIFPWKNQAWLCMNTANAKSIYKLQSFNPVTGAQVFYSYPAGSPSSLHQAVFFSVDDRLFIVWALNNRDSGNAPVYEFSLGAWVSAGVSIRFDRGLPVGGTQNGTGWANGTAFRVGDAAYLICKGSNAGGSGASNDGLSCYKFTVASPGGALQVSEHITVIPSNIRRGTATLPDQDRYLVRSIVDDQTDPTSPTAYVIFCPESDVETSATAFRFVDDSTELINEGTLPTSSSYGFPDTFFGSGHFLNGIETGSKLVTGEVWTAAKGQSGAQINYRLFGDPLVAAHGAVTGGPFEVGETITSSSGGSATILEARSAEVRLHSVSGAFNDTDTLTQTTGTNAGANAAQSGASTGGAANKTFRLRYFRSGTKTLGVPSTGICTLIPGTNTRGSIVGGNEIQNEIAEWSGNDGPGSGQVEWDFITDGVAEASIVVVKAEVVTP